MGTRCKGKCKIISVEVKTKKDKDGKQDKKTLFFPIRVKRYKRKLPRDYNLGTRAERKAERLSKLREGEK